MPHPEISKTEIETIPALDSLELDDATVKSLRTYEGVWKLVKHHKFIQIVLPLDSGTDQAALRNRFKKAIKKEKLMDPSAVGQLRFGYYQNIMLVRLI